LFEGSTGTGVGSGFIGPKHDFVEPRTLQSDCKTTVLDKATTVNADNFIEIILLLLDFS
jgi:hypothetical protein